MELQPGDRVHWTDLKRKGAGVTMTTKRGRVDSVHGPWVCIKGRKDMVLRSNIRKDGEPTHLTDFVKGMAEAVLVEKV